MKLSKLIAGALALSLIAAACSDEETTAEPTETTATEEVTAEPEPSTDDTTDDESSEQETDDEEAAEEGSATFAIEETAVTFTIGSCTNPGETTISFMGESAEGTIIDISAEEQVGGITIDGPEGSWEGSIDAVEVGDLGNFTISGTASVADDSAEGGPFDFTLTGQCPLS